MRILILGGRGFLGKSLVEAFSGTPHTVFVYSRRNGLNLLSFSSTRRVMKHVRPDVIYSCAAHVGSVHYVMKHAGEVAYENMQMVLNIYKAVQNVCPRAVVVNPLSNCSYPGDASVHVEPDWFNGAVHDSVLSYGNTRRMIYVLARCFHQQWGIRSINFLVPNAYGPGDYTDPDKTHAMNGLILRMLEARREKQKTFEIWGSGKPVREWGFVKDIARVLQESIALDADLIYPVNIAQKRGYSIAESARTVKAVVGYHGKLRFNTRYPDGAPIKILDDTRFRRFFPNFSFTDHTQGIHQTVSYYETVLPT